MATPEYPVGSNNIRRVVLIGGALSDEIVSAHPMASAAAARWQLDVARALRAELRCRVTCLSYLPTTSRVAPEEGIIDEIEVVTAPRTLGGIMGSVRYFRSMMTHVRALQEADLVICYNPLIWTAPLAALAASRTRAPLVLIVADVEPKRAPDVRRLVRHLVERGLLGVADRFLVLSPATVELLPRGARSAVFNGLYDASAASLEPPSYDGTETRFVYSGSFTYDNGVDLFLEAARQYLAESSGATGVTFHIFGRGPVKLEVPTALGDRITLHGFVDSAMLNEFLSHNCVTVNPRRKRFNAFNLPSKLLYYMSRGTVTISTLTDGVPPDLAERCIMVSDDDVAGLVRSFHHVLSMSPHDRRDFGSRGRDLVLGTRSPKVLVDLLASLV